MIAMKREVAAHCEAGFPWSECQVMKTGDKSLYRQKFLQARVVENGCRALKVRDTPGSVYSHRLSYLDQQVRKGGDFFYGKSGNENHIEGL